MRIWSMGYYFISIGGSGAKVMESLTHLCAAGLLPNKEKQQKLYVMAIDPDIGNGNLKHSSAALNCFAQFQDVPVGMDTPLFKTEVELAKPFIWNPAEHDKKLDDILSYQIYKGSPIGNLYEVLYTQEERNTFLNEGFRGRPSIGAAVLAKKVQLGDGTDGLHVDTAPWDKFSRLVHQDAKNGQTAKIFLAGSVFGGTGAAGMPTIAHLLRRTFGNYYDEGKVMIGGALILPYFAFTPSLSDQESYGIFASSENFLTNTKAALKYYALKDKDYHSLYFIGDDILSPVTNFSIGASTQNNDAHVVDLYGAMAAIDFYGSTPENRKEYSYLAHAKENTFHWTDFPDILMDDQTQVSFKNRFIQFTRFIFSYVHLVKPVLGDLASGKIPSYKYPWFLDYLADLNISDAAVRNFHEYTETFTRWLQQIETSENHRAVELIRKSSFDANPASIVPDQFSSCAYDENSEVTIHELWYRFSERTCADMENTKGFGRFLR
ncbi:MAG: hypothetical protein IKH16_04250, partial [Selenomonadaceae bacterium]|nr:hypothetical protein [Selenomonadaceae bacterium]